MVKRIRLWTGLILFAYVTTHLINHALGVISLDAMEAGRTWFLAVWRNPVGTTLVVAALLIHLGLAFWALYTRRSLRMPFSEAAQYVMGFAIPLVLLPHITGTRLVHELYGVNDTYTYALWVYWVATPERAVTQTLLLLLAWIHGTIGLHHWLRLKPGFKPWAGAYLAFAILVPVLSLLGFYQGGKEVIAMAQDKAQLDQMIASFRLPGPEVVAFVVSLPLWERLGFLGVVLLVFLARVGRALNARRRGIVRLSYPDGRMVEAQPGMTVLEASRTAGVPHASVCGGRGRCSTCRVRVGEGRDDLPEPTPEEQRVLDRVSAPPHVRLACQIRPARPLEVTPLLPPTASPRDGHRRPAHLQGRDQEIAILFADLRSFTQFAETKLPYDVVFVLNRYFSAMGEAIADANGHLDKFIGDGVMALFGIETDSRQGCRDAIIGARNMSLQLQKLNDSLKSDLAEPLRIGIGIHVGAAIIGEMGYGQAISLTAIGDAVNTASRLEATTKNYGAQLIVSNRVERYSGLDLSAYKSDEISIRGRKEAMQIRIVDDASELPDFGTSSTSPSAAPPPDKSAAREATPAGAK